MNKLRNVTECMDPHLHEMLRLMLEPEIDSVLSANQEPD